MASNMRELVWTHDISASIDTGIERLQPCIGLDGTSRRKRNSQCLQPETRSSRCSPNRAQQGIEGKRFFRSIFMAHNQTLLAGDAFTTNRLGSGQYANAIRA